MQICSRAMDCTAETSVAVLLGYTFRKRLRRPRCIDARLEQTQRLFEVTHQEDIENDSF